MLCANSRADDLLAAGAVPYKRSSWSPSAPVETRCSPERDLLMRRVVTVSPGVAPLTRQAQTFEELTAAAYRVKRAGKEPRSGHQRLLTDLSAGSPA
jgi:hypothetical protein